MSSDCELLSQLNYLPMVGKLRVYLKDLRQEFSRINWPRLREVINMSLVVIVISLVVAAFLGLWDFVFVNLLQKIIG